MWDILGYPRPRIAETIFSDKPTYVVEPTPDGRWQAYETGYDLFDPIGYGNTRDEAVEDLLEQLRD